MTFHCDVELTSLGTSLPSSLPISREYSQETFDVAKGLLSLSSIQHQDSPVMSDADNSLSGDETISFKPSTFRKGLSRKRPFLSLNCNEDARFDTSNDTNFSRRDSKRVRFDLELEYKASQPATASVQCIPPKPMVMGIDQMKTLHKYNMLRKGTLANGQTVVFIVPPFAPATQECKQVGAVSSQPVAQTKPAASNFPLPNRMMEQIIQGVEQSRSQSSVSQPPSIINTAVPSKEIESHPTNMDIDNSEQNFVGESLTKKPNLSVQLCQAVSNVFSARPSPDMSLYAEPLTVDRRYSLCLRPMYTEEEILKFAENFFGVSQASIWRDELYRHTSISSLSRAAYLKKQSSTKNPRIKVIFQLLQCSDFFYSERGQSVAKELLLSCFVQDFKDSILRVLVPEAESVPTSMDCDDIEPNMDSEQLSVSSDEFCTKSKISLAKAGSVRWKNQQILLATLPLAYFCVSHLMAEHGMKLEHNLCQFLLLVSCLEARGVYHYRASNNLSLAHKTYRYMIERIGGKNYASMSLDSCERAEKELIRTFETV